MSSLATFWLVICPRYASHLTGIGLQSWTSPDQKSRVLSRALAFQFRIADCVELGGWWVVV
jgi:hypothetical protein